MYSQATVDQCRKLLMLEKIYLPIQGSTQYNRIKQALGLYLNINVLSHNDEKDCEDCYRNNNKKGLKQSAVFLNRVYIR